ncbi:SIR2 family protein [Rothia mucilaginosa]
MHILEEIREVAVSKNVNFLIGSGCSVGAIGTMGEYWEDAWKEKNLNEDGTEKSPTCCKDKEYCEACQKRGNELLVIDVKKVSQEIIEGKLEENFVTKNYNFFISEIVNLMHRMNSRQNPKNINIFTTNYDLFIEDALDKVSKTETFVINDGARGYFKRILDSSNFNRTVSYRGPSNNYVDEIPSISLIKPHGSVNWEKTADKEIEIKAEIVINPIVVNPDGHESRATFEENYFHDMLRIFQTELDKPQSVLFVIGFSFQDKHIVKMMQRALRNKELNVYIFCYEDDDKIKIGANLGRDSSDIKNLKFIRPKDIQSGELLATTKDLTLDIVTKILKSGGK